MKKILMILALAVAFLASAVVPAQAQLAPKEAKAIEKDSKKVAKKLERAGWQTMVATHSLDYLLTKYNMFLAEDPVNHKPLRGIAIGQNNKIGRQNAINDAINNYAANASSQVVGKLKSIVNSDNRGESIQEIDKFGAAYERAVKAKLPAAIKEHFVLVKTEKNGTKEFNAFLSLDESEARKIREEANRIAEEETQIKTLSEQVSEFIGEPVEMPEQD